MAALPGSGMAALRPGSPGAADGLAVDEALIARAVVAGGLDPVRAEPLLRALRWIHGVARAHPGAQAPGDPPDLVSMIEDWLRAVAGSAPRARGAALLAAHVLLTHAAQINSEQCAVTGIGSATAQQRLEAQGARFEPQLTDEGPPSYAGNWLRDAWVLDDGGPVGDLALPLLLEPCAAGEGGFLWAAREGEGFLARPHDRETQASVHLLVAVAYTGGIALAAEEAEELHREPYSAAELDGYRAKAIAHYRAAFATDLAPDAVEEHWGDAWRLIAGLPPLRGPFQCGC